MTGRTIDPDEKFNHFYSDGDFNFWKKVIQSTEKCKETGRSTKVGSLYFSTLVVKSVFLIVLL